MLSMLGRLTEKTQVHGRNGYVQCTKGNNSTRRQIRVMVHVFYKWSHSYLHLCVKFCYQSYSFCILQVVSWCFTFVRNFIIISRTVFNLQSGHEYMVEMAMFNVQKAITPKAGKPELQFMCSAYCFIVLYICVKFHENILDGIRVMEWTQMMEAMTNGWTLQSLEGIT